MNILEFALLMYCYAALIAVLAISLYGIVCRPNILKKIICLSIFGDTANTLIIFLGFRTKNPIPPIVPTLTPTKALMTEFTTRAVDPVPQCLVITAIVINMAILMFLIFLAIQIYRHYGTLDARKVARLRG